MIYLTGDTHGNFTRLDLFCHRMQTTKDDTMIILGDAGFNYYRGKRDDRGKQYASFFPIKLFCIHGNHEIRPQNIPSYIEGTFHGGKVLYEEAYPDILFAVDGEVYDFDGYKCLVIGGAYSVDKFYRLERGFGWWADEQPSAEIKKTVEERIEQLGGQIDIVLSHTCPLRYEPVEVFLQFIDQASVDKSTEIWLGEIEEKLTYKKWYCGHYHTEKRIDKMRFMFNDYDVLSLETEKAYGEEDHGKAVPATED